MKKFIHFAAMLVFIGGTVSLPGAEADIRNKAEFSKIVANDARLEKLAGGMKFTEGPVWLPEDGGTVVFSDLFSSELKQWNQKGGLKTIRRPESPLEGTYYFNGNTV